MRTVDFRPPATAEDQDDYCRQLSQLVKEFPARTDFTGRLGEVRVVVDFEGLPLRLRHSSRDVQAKAIKDFKNGVTKLLHPLRKSQKDRVRELLAKQCAQLGPLPANASQEVDCGM